MAYRRRVSQYIELDGPIWDAVESGRIKDALADAILGLAKEGAEQAQGFVQGAGFVKSGRFVRGIGVEVHRSRGAGYANVMVVDQGAAYPTANRPTRTFMEYGTRRGQKIRTANYAFRKTKRALDKVKYDGYFVPALMKVLE